MSKERLISEIELLVRRDPARRGLIGPDGEGPGTGELIEASRLFLDIITGVFLVTGFFIPDRNPTCETGGRTGGGQDIPVSGNAETDGPPGTAVLADVLAGLGVPVTVVTDALCEQVVRTACSIVTRYEIDVIASPIESVAAAGWRAEVQNRSDFQNLSHIVAIERVGPGHTRSSLQETDPAATSFINGALVNNPILLPGHCCNMRGENIDAFSADLHLLMESARSRNPTVKTIGIGDGGNEIGMGRFPWSELRARLSGPDADRIPCRIATDRTIVAGVSNWGAHAMAASISVQFERLDLLERHTAESQERLIEKIVSDSGAVDGITRRREPTVDGLPFITQIQPWIAIRKRLGLQP